MAYKDKYTAWALVSPAGIVELRHRPVPVCNLRPGQRNVRLTGYFNETTPVEKKFDEIHRRAGEKQ